MEDFQSEKEKKEQMKQPYEYLVGKEINFKGRKPNENDLLE